MAYIWTSSQGKENGHQLPKCFCLLIHQVVKSFKLQGFYNVVSVFVGIRYCEQIIQNWTEGTCHWLLLPLEPRSNCEASLDGSTQKAQPRKKASSISSNDCRQLPWGTFSFYHVWSAVESRIITSFISTNSLQSSTWMLPKQTAPEK